MPERSLPWKRALHNWAQSLYPNSTLTVADGPAAGTWLIARRATAGPDGRPLIVTPVPVGVTWEERVKAAHHTPHPVLAILQGKSGTIRPVRWSADKPTLGPTQVTLAPDLSPATAATVNAVLRRPPPKTRHKKRS